MQAQEAHIITTRTAIHPTGRYYETHAWEGEKHWLVYLPFLVDVKHFPWKLHQVGVDFSRGDYVYIRKDAFLPRGWWTMFTLWLQKHYWPFFNKFMATLNIWGLAYTPMGCVPSWKDIGKKCN